jgi:hypothetical protein
MRVTSVSKSNRRTRLLLLFASLLLSWAGCSKPSDKAESIKPDPPSEEYAVYSTLLNQMLYSPEDGKPVKLFVINDETSADKVMSFPPEKVFENYKLTLAPEFGAALKDYKEKNREPLKLGNSFELKSDYWLLSRKDFYALFKDKEGDDFWFAFHRKYPDASGYITFSRVGFDPEMRHAVLYMEIQCGGTCGQGSYKLLSKEAGAWKLVQSLALWAS